MNELRSVLRNADSRWTTGSGAKAMKLFKQVGMFDRIDVLLDIKDSSRPGLSLDMFSATLVDSV